MKLGHVGLTAKDSNALGQAGFCEECAAVLIPSKGCLPVAIS